MTVLEIFEKVNLQTPVEQRLFFNYLNDSVNEIGELHGDMPRTVFGANITAADIVPVSSLTDEMILLPLYHNAVVDNILFLCGQGDTHKGEFVRKTQESFLHYWNLYSKGRHIKRNGW